jgi:hypothetical protein
MQSAAATLEVHADMKFYSIIFVFLFACPTFCRAESGKQQKPSAECTGVVHGTLFGPDGKAWSGIDLILDPPGDLAYLLPSTRSNDHGEFRFENVCNGTWGVFVHDERAGCRDCSRYLNKFLYGYIPPDFEIKEASSDVHLDVHAPPKPGILAVHLVNSKTRNIIPRAELELTVNRKRSIGPSCDTSTAFTCDGGAFEVPPDIAVRLRIKAKGFHEWKPAGGRVKILRVSSGEVQTIIAELSPIHN